MSSGTTSSERLTEALDSAVAEEAQQGPLDDSEIQRLVVLSRDAAYQRSERVPVKPVEAFEPRSLVSIAMDAQRRREAEMRTAAAAGAAVDPEAAAEIAPSETPETIPDEQPQDAMPKEAPVDAAGAQTDATAPASQEGENAVAGAAGQMLEEAGGEAGQEEASTQGTSQIDFEAGRAAGIEEGRQSGFEDGHVKGLEEGRAAGRAEASAQLERAIQAFEAATEKLGGLAEIDSSALGESLHNAILTLASERAGRAIAEQPDAFADRIEGLLTAIRTASGQPVIHLNPGDLGSIQPLVETREKLRHCNFVAAPELAAGDLTVTVGTIGIDDIILPSAQTPNPTASAADSASDDIAPSAGDGSEDMTGMADDQTQDVASDHAPDAGMDADNAELAGGTDE